MVDIIDHPGHPAHRCIAPLLRIVPWPPTFARSSKALRSSRVIPAKNPFLSCKYSTGREPYNTIVMLLQLLQITLTGGYLAGFALTTPQGRGPDAAGATTLIGVEDMALGSSGTL